MEKHPIDKLFQEQLFEGEKTPQRDLWERVESKLDASNTPKKNRRWKWLLWIGGILLIVSSFGIRQWIQRDQPEGYTPYLLTEQVREWWALIQERNEQASIAKDSISDKLKPAKTHSSPPYATLSKEITSVEEKGFQKQRVALIDSSSQQQVLPATLKEESTPSTQTTDQVKVIEMPRTIKVKVKIYKQTPPGAESKADKDTIKTRIGRFFRKVKKIKNGEEKIKIFGQSSQEILNQVGQ
ncbi:MAG: hypothetical protein ACFB0B_16950 [Thermonemataceae bacterium]